MVLPGGLTPLADTNELGLWQLAADTANLLDEVSAAAGRVGQIWHASTLGLGTTRIASD
jgi:hypothetical protein